MPAKMKLCFDTGHTHNIKVYRQDNALPVKTSLNTFSFHNRNNSGKESNFMNVAVLKKTKGGCSACGR